MAAPPPLASGIKPPDPLHSPRTRRKSFADIVTSSTMTASIGIKEPRVYCGKPAVVFTKKEADMLAERYKFSLVGKFSHGKPTMEIIRSRFATFRLKGAYQVGYIDVKHVLITLALEEDYIRLWLKTIWYIDGAPMRLFKWTKTFHPRRESPLVPVWITFPFLPVHLFEKSALFSVANLVGKPLKMDEPTTNVTRPSLARVCVEVDVSKPLIETVWIAEFDESASEGAGLSGFWQEVEYESAPPYCSYCLHVGHMESGCLQKTPPKNDQSQNATTKTAPAPKQSAKTIPQKEQVYVPKASRKSAQEKGKAVFENHQDKVSQKIVKKSGPTEEGFMRDARKSNNAIEKEDLRVLLDDIRKSNSETSGEEDVEKLAVNEKDSKVDDLIVLDGADTKGEVITIDGITIDLPIEAASPSLLQIEHSAMVHSHQLLRRKSDGDQIVEAMMADLIPATELRMVCGEAEEGDQRGLEEPLIPTAELAKICKVEGPATRTRRAKEITKGSAPPPRSK